MRELTDWMARRRANKPAVDPLGTTHENYVRQMKKIGLGVTKQGTVFKLAKGAGSK
jgi:hypothetical protein